MHALAVPTGALPERKAPFLTRLKAAFKDEGSRKYFVVYLAGKMIGLMAVIAIAYFFMKCLGDKAFAQDAADAAPAAKADDIINPLNTVWVLVTAFLVFFMQAGFMMLEAGFARLAGDRERPARVHRRHLPVRSAVLGLRLRLHVRRGQRLDRAQVLLPAHRHRHLRVDGRSPSWRSSCSSSPSPTPARPSPPAPWSDGPASTATCSTASASAGSSTRSSATGSGVPTAGSPPIMSTPFRDFAGSTVVHTVGGMIALAGAIALGPRLGRKFKRDGGGMPPATT